MGRHGPAEAVAAWEACQQMDARAMYLRLARQGELTTNAATAVELAIRRLAAAAALRHALDAIGDSVRTRGYAPNDRLRELDLALAELELLGVEPPEGLRRGRARRQALPDAA